MPRRRTIGESPLDAVVPPSEPPAEEGVSSAKAGEATPGPSPRVTRARITVQLPLELAERMRNAVYWTPGLTLAGLAARAISREVDALEAERGEGFMPRQQELRPGRPLH